MTDVIVKNSTNPPPDGRPFVLVTTQVEGGAFELRWAPGYASFEEASEAAERLIRERQIHAAYVLEQRAFVYPQPAVFA